VAALAFRFSGIVWQYEGPAAWYFVSLPPDCADAVADTVVADSRGFGSVRVEVTIGSSRWRTSLFPDRRRGTYVLPVKKSVRTAEGLEDGSRADVSVVVLDADDR